MVKHDLFVVGTKCKASTPETLPDPEVIEAPQPLPKKCKMARTAWEISLPPPADGVIYVRKRPVDAGASAQPAQLPETEDLQLRNSTLCASSLSNEEAQQGPQLRCQEDQVHPSACRAAGTSSGCHCPEKDQGRCHRQQEGPELDPEEQGCPQPQQIKNLDEDAEGDDDLELTQPPNDAAPTPAVDNDINMDVPAHDDVPALPDQPEAHEDVDLAPSLQQPTPLDILKSIEALGNKFDSLLKKSDCAEAMHQEMDSQVTALDQQWAQRFATMEKRMQDIESQTDGNVASIRYITNALANPTTARFTSFVPPPAGPSTQGHPYGQIPGSWVLKLPSVLDASQPLDHTVSTVGRQWTTFWDQSKGPEPAGPGDTSASAVQPSGSHIRLSRSSQLSSLPSAASSPKFQRWL
ncbi:hypothetical protein DFH29DRAFT_881985 [Suillus ampliporus]|nr:hypothetical protein DFH29DRAFT_881985 [Suillus ampliporus]